MLIFLALVIMKSQHSCAILEAHTVEVFYGGLQVNLLLPLSPLQCQSVQLSKNL